jgi:DNA-binding response OmpR family regulator
MRVLIVEDDPEINQLLSAYAELAGFEPDSALGGHDALTASASGTHSLVLLDLMLPDMDGFEVARRMKAAPATAGVPVVILTALTSDVSRKQAEDVGAAHYMTKPFDPDELIQLMHQHARKK